MYHLLWLIKATKRELDRIHPPELAFQASHQTYLRTNQSQWICDLGSLTNQSSPKTTLEIYKNENSFELIFWNILCGTLIQCARITIPVFPTECHFL